MGSAFEHRGNPCKQRRGNENQRQRPRPTGPRAVTRVRPGRPQGLTRSGNVGRLLGRVSRPLDDQPVAGVPHPGTERRGGVRPPVFLLELSALARKVETRVLVHEGHGRRLRARKARRKGARVRRQIVLGVLQSRPEAEEAVPVGWPADHPVEAEPETLINEALLQRIGAYKAESAALFASPDA